VFKWLLHMTQHFENSPPKKEDKTNIQSAILSQYIDILLL
jgi:hypothetical protein